MTESEKKTDYLHGITLENLLSELVDIYGWNTLAGLVRINCFRSDPSIKSSLKFLRKTLWARSQVEAIFCGYKENESIDQIRQRLKKLAAPVQQEKRQQNKSQTKAVLADDPWSKARQKNQQQ